MNKEQIEFFKTNGYIGRDTLGVANSIYSKWDLAAANVKLFTQHIRPSFNYRYGGNGESVIHNSGSRLYDNIFFSKICKEIIKASSERYFV